MKLFITILTLFLSISLKSQYCYVDDKDGFVNVREEPNANSKIVCRLNNRQIVFIPEYTENDSLKNWVLVEFYLTKEEVKTVKSKPDDWMPDVMKGNSFFHGYIYKDRLLNIEEQKSLQRKESDNVLLLFNDSIKIKFTAGDFKKEKHKIQYQEEYLVTKIDGHDLVGTDESMPRHEIKSFVVEIKNKKLDLPYKVYYDLYEPNFENTYAFADKNGYAYIVMYNSDAAGTYCVIFVFKDNKYLTRYIFPGEC
jgi:hypothetical protein